MKAARIAAAAFCLAMFGGGPASAGDNWMRDAVTAWEHAQMARVFGKAAADDSSVHQDIIGGRVAAAGHWPFQVGLLFADETNNFLAQYCGGSLVAAQYVITAAHCVDFIPSAASLQVLTGTQSLARGGTRRNVAWFVFNPNWDPITADFDIAVVKLAQPTSGIPFATLINREQEAKIAEPGTLATVTGWGDIAPGNPIHYPTELREVSVPIVSNGVCNGPSSYNGQITARMLCAGLKNGGKDSCQGDSGGPLLVSAPGITTRLQAGITSWGEGCALPNFYGVYARVGVLSAWANSIIARGATAPCNGLAGPQALACIQNSAR